MYPGSAASSSASKFQNRCASPQFASFASPLPADYPSQQQQQHQQHPQQQLAGQTTSVAVHSAPGGHGSMRHIHRNQLTMSGHSTHGHGLGHGHGHGHGHGLGLGLGHTGAATLGHHHSGHRGDLIFPDDMDSIEFCMPAPPASSSSSSSQQNGELLLLQGGHGEPFTERRRRGHSRRSNHKMDVEQQVKWSRKNIAATMERFEPTTNSVTNNTKSSSSTSSLDYGFAAGVMTPSSSSATPSHGASSSAAGMSSTASLHVAYNGAGGAGVSGGASAAAAAAPFNHVYSYAYYEPGAAKCHTNVPAQGHLQGQGNGLPHHHQQQQQQQHHLQQHGGQSKSPPRNSIRALLAKSFRSKSSSHSGQSASSSPSAEERDRHTYTTRYGTTENLYEEVSDQKIRKVLSDNRIATSSAGNVKEELRRVQHNHFRVLDELNLSLEALIMPPTPPDISPSHANPPPPSASCNDVQHEPPTTSNSSCSGSGSGSAVGANSSSSQSSSGQSVGQGKNVLSTGQRPRRGGLLGGAAASAASNSSSASHASLENLSSTLNCMELKDHAHSSCINPEFDEGDLDSGFSGSGSSSGASYNESLRYYKTATPTSHSHSHGHGHGLGHVHGHGHSHNTNVMGQGNYNNNNNNNNNNHIHTLPHNLRSCRSSTASGTSTSKSSMASCGEDQGISGMGMSMNMVGMAMNINMGISESIASGNSSMSPFNYPRRCSADQQRASGRSMASANESGMGAAASAVSTMANATGAKPKKNFWTMKP